MKKIISILIAIMMMVTGCALGEGGGLGLPNPWSETTEEGFIEELGLHFNVPEGAENVIFRVLAEEGLGEMLFTLDGMELTARIKAAAEFEDISGMYYAWENEEDVEISGRSGKKMSAKDDDKTVDLVMWFDAAPGIMYSLSAQGEDLDGFDITAVAEMVYSPMQGMVNPWIDVTEDEFIEKLGFSLNIPENAENVAFRALESAGLGEMLFTLDGVELTARIKAAAEFEDISGMYYTWENEEDVEISGRAGKIMSAKDDDKTVDLVMWFDAAPGIMYSLSAQGEDLDGFDITAVAEMVFAPMQGDA